MTKGKKTLVQKDRFKEIAPNNYRPITYLPMMWKFLPTQIREESYYPLTSCGFIPEEQKGCHKGTRGKAELLDIDKHIHKEGKTWWKNYAMAWTDYKIAYDMIPQSKIINFHKMYKISDEIINYID